MPIDKEIFKQVMIEIDKFYPLPIDQEHLIAHRHEAMSLMIADEVCWMQLVAAAYTVAELINTPDFKLKERGYRKGLNS